MLSGITTLLAFPIGLATPSLFEYPPPHTHTHIHANSPRAINPSSSQPIQPIQPANYLFQLLRTCRIEFRKQVLPRFRKPLTVAAWRSFGVKAVQHNNMQCQEWPRKYRSGERLTPRVRGAVLCGSSIGGAFAAAATTAATAGSIQGIPNQCCYCGSGSSCYCERAARVILHWQNSFFEGDATLQTAKAAHLSLNGLPAGPA
jgi:hypothetical protein